MHRWSKECPDIASLIGEVYSASGTDNGWMCLFETVRSIFSATAVGMASVGATFKGTFLGVTGIDPQRVKEFATDFAVPEDNPWLVPGRHLQEGAVGIDAEVVSMDALKSSRLYADWARPQRVERFIGVNINKDDRTTVGIDIFGSAEWLDPTPDDLRILRCIAPHARNALRLHTTIASARALSLNLVRGMELSGVALLILGPDGAIRHTTSAAEEILARDDGLTSIRNRLVFSEPEAATARRAELLISAGRCATPPAKSADDSSILVRRKRGLGMYRLSFNASPPNTIFPEQSDYRTVVLIHEIGPGDETPHTLSRADKLARFTAKHGLTSAEARLLQRLTEGLSLRDAAGEIGRSYATVRSQLKTVFHKCGVTRQAELIALALA